MVDNGVQRVRLIKRNGLQARAHVTRASSHFGGLLAPVVACGGPILPLLVAAVLGGEGVKAGGGLIGFGLVAGLALRVCADEEVAAGW